MTAVYLFFLAGITVLSGCRNEHLGARLLIAGGTELIFADLQNGKEWIVTDTIDGFFDQIGILDMSLQLKRGFPDSTTRAALLPLYLSQLQNEVLTFEEKEVQFATDVFKEIASFLKKYPGMKLPDKIRLIKVKGDLYGKDVFYTRQNAIIIPADRLRTGDTESFTSTMLHEIFHIYTRYQPERKAVLYGIFGFELLPCQSLNFPDTLQSRLLVNPDGLDRRWGIRVKVNRDTLLTVPLIYAKEPAFNRHHPDFMTQIGFNLYVVSAEENRLCRVLTEKGEKSTIDVYSLPDFFEKTGRNTNYIIHPDEILADNFVLLYTTLGDPMKSKKLTPVGRHLLEKLHKSL